MIRIGVLGGMSWESTQEYYKNINRNIQRTLGGNNSGDIILYSFNFQDIAKLQYEGKWNELGKLLGEKGKMLKECGAKFIVLATNTMHKLAETIEEKSGIQLLHIADVTGKDIVEKGFQTVGLLGTIFTMKEDFYKKRLEEKFGIKIVTPNEEEMNFINNVIYTELCKGIIRSESKRKFLQIIDNLRKNGAQGIILGCTEIPLLVKQIDTNIPLFDTMTLHCNAAAKYALEETNENNFAK